MSYFDIFFNSIHARNWGEISNIVTPLRMEIIGSPRVMIVEVKNN